jgi:hypothetical protein
MGTQMTTEQILAQMATQITALQQQILQMSAGGQQAPPPVEKEKRPKFAMPDIFEGSADKLPAFLTAVKLYAPTVSWGSDIEKKQWVLSYLQGLKVQKVQGGHDGGPRH